MLKTVEVSLTSQHTHTQSNSPVHRVPLFLGFTDAVIAGKLARVTKNVNITQKKCNESLWKTSKYPTCVGKGKKTRVLKAIIKITK